MVYGLELRVEGCGLRRRNVKRFRGGLVFTAHRLVYHSTLGWRVINNKKTRLRRGGPCATERIADPLS